MGWSYVVLRFMVIQWSVDKLKYRGIDPFCDINSQSLLEHKPPIPMSSQITASFAAEQKPALANYRANTRYHKNRQRYTDKICLMNVMDHILFNEPLNPQLFAEEEREQYSQLKKQTEYTRPPSIPIEEFIKLDLTKQEDRKRIRESCPIPISDFELIELIIVIIDIHRAYNQVPVHDMEKNRFLVYDPTEDKFVAFESAVMCFGNVHSVIAWCRLSDAWKNFLVNWVRGNAHCFIDDISTMMKKEIAERFVREFTQLLKLARIPYGENKVQCADVVELLGLLIAVLEDGSVWHRVSPQKAKKMTILLEMIMKEKGASRKILEKFVGLSEFIATNEGNTAEIRTHLRIIRRQLRHLELKKRDKEVVEPVSAQVTYSLNCVYEAIISSDWKKVVHPKNRDQFDQVIITDASWTPSGGGFFGAIIVKRIEDSNQLHWSIFKLEVPNEKIAKEHLDKEQAINWLETCCPVALLASDCQARGGDTGFFNDNTTAEENFRNAKGSLPFRAMAIVRDHFTDLLKIISSDHRTPSPFNLSDAPTRRLMWETLLRMHEEKKIFDRFGEFNQALAYKITNCESPTQEHRVLFELAKRDEGGRLASDEDFEKFRQWKKVLNFKSSTESDSESELEMDFDSEESVE